MKIPQSADKLLDFARDKILECTYSQGERASAAANNLAYYEYGTTGTKPSLYNRTGVHIDRTASYLYAPGEIRYSIGFDATDGDPWLTRAQIAAKYLSREYRRADADVIFSQGVEVALIKNCAIMKHNWMGPESLHPGFDPQLIHPEFFGVEREDLQRLEDQQCFVHTYYLSKHQIRQIAEGRPDETEILREIKKLGGGDGGDMKTNWLHQVVLGGVNPVAKNTASGAQGQVSVSASSQTQFSPEMLAELLRVDELWCIDSKRDDYTTIQVVEGQLLLEGKYRHQNLTGVKGLQPFSKICADPVSGYFWGKSEVERVKTLQDMLTELMSDIRRLMRLRTRRPKAYIGFQGVTSQKARSLQAPNGYIVEGNPGAKVEDLAPPIPPEIFGEVQSIVGMFDEVGGFKPIMQGEGESGVRAGVHAATLMKTASPKLRERALRIERDAEASANIVFELMQSKVPRVFKSEQEEFYLNQIPDDHFVEVDSHTASPIFTDDTKGLALNLKKLGVIDAEDVLRMLNLPMSASLIAGVKKREAAKQQFLKDHPEAISGKKPKA